MKRYQIGIALVLAVAVCGGVSHGETVVQGAGDDFVSFTAGGAHAVITYEATGTVDAVITDNGDGTLTTVSRGDDGSGDDNDNGLVTYNIDFNNAGDYYLYFNFHKITDDSVYVNHVTGFNSVPGTSGDERWNSLDEGWNGLFEIGDGLGDNSNYGFDPPYNWNVAAPSTVSFTVRNREAGVMWKDFVFSKGDDHTVAELNAMIGILPPEPLAPVSPIAFVYDSATGTRTISGMLDTTGAGGTGEVLFTGVLPAPDFVDPNPNLTPAGSVGTITEQSGSHNEDGKTVGVSWAGKGPVTLTGTDGVNDYSVDVELIFGPSGDGGYDNPTEDRLSSYHPISGEDFDYQWVVKTSDDALAEHGGDAVSTGENNDHPRLAIFYGVGREEANGLAHRHTQDETAFILGPDAYENTDNTKGDGERWTKYAAYQPLGLYFGWRDKDTLGGGSFQVDSIAFSGNLPVDLDAMVPEPATMSLLVIGGLGVLFRRRRVRS